MRQLVRHHLKLERVAVGQRRLTGARWLRQLPLLSQLRPKSQANRVQTLFTQKLAIPKDGL